MYVLLSSMLPGTEGGFWCIIINIDRLSKRVLCSLSRYNLFLAFPWGILNVIFYMYRIIIECLN